MVPSEQKVPKIAVFKEKTQAILNGRQIPSGKPIECVAVQETVNQVKQLVVRFSTVLGTF
jgi:hypothetical protein